MSRTLYRHPISGHSHRVEVALSLFGLPVTLETVDFSTRAHKAPAFLARNAFGQVPVLVDEDGTVLADSNAILVYLALRYPEARPWLPTSPVEQAAVQRWFTVAAGPLLASAGTARRVNVLRTGGSVDTAIAAAHDLFRVLDAHLGDRAWFVGERPSLADISLYTYTAHAPEGGVDLAPYGAIRGWIDRFEALPGFVPMGRAPVGLWAPA